MIFRAIRTLPAALALLASAVLPGLSHAQGEPIRIGAVVSATGPAGFVGDPQRKTLEVMVKRVNEAGGLLGRKIELTVYDDQSDPNSANTFAKRLLESDKVDVLLGGTISPAAMAMAPHAERLGVPYVSTGAAQALVDPVRKWVFRVTPSDRLQAQRMLQDVKDRGFSRIAILSESSGFGQSGRKEILSVAERMGLQVLGDETYGPRDSDVVPQLTKLRGQKDIQALIFFCGPGPAGAMTMKNYTQLSMTQPVYMPSAVLSSFIRIVTELASQVHRIYLQEVEDSLATLLGSWASTMAALMTTHRTIRRWAFECLHDTAFVFQAAMLEVLGLPATNGDQLVNGCNHVVADASTFDGIKECAA